MNKVRNILFIMADQLRWDYLSCYGHPHLKTPNIDGLAKKGILFESAYVQSPVCGPSRASYYTGRTVFSHGSTWNQVPLPIGELTIGDYLSKSGIRTLYNSEIKINLFEIGYHFLISTQKGCTKISLLVNFLIEFFDSKQIV